jgi:hypothetical protein
MAADQGGFQHAGGEGVDLLLQQHAAQLRDAPWRQRRQLLAAEAHIAGQRRAQAGQGVQQRGLAGAVAAEDRQAFAGVELEVEATDQGAPADGGGEVAHLEQDRAHSRPPFGWRESR